MTSELQSVTLKLFDYCRRNNWAGYEPYDALNSGMFTAVPSLNAKLPRLVLTQLLKRSPVNFRGLLRIPRTQNPKALGLFLSSIVKLRHAGVDIDPACANQVVERLIALRSPDSPYWCWGYNFPWQTRTVIVPRWRPNLVCTTFAAFGLLDLFDQQGDENHLRMAQSAAEFLLNELYWKSGDRGCGFGYPLPEVHNQVHNANLLASALFCRISRLSGGEKFVEPALAVTRYTVAQQRGDGGWNYGEAASQQWVDNFHTGFNLSALRSIALALETSEFDSSIAAGFKFYREHFFREDGAVGYYDRQFYPIDAHCAAQSIITLIDLKYLDPSNVDLAHKVYAWAKDHMWCAQEGFFYYRVLRTCTIRTSYMRWTQAWMLLALSMLLDQLTPASTSGGGNLIEEVAEC